MALIDVKCTAAEPHTSEVHRPIADWPATPPCPECGAPTEQIHLPPRVRWQIDPVVVFRAHDGSLRFPGDTTGAMTKQYERHGYERIELRSAADVRRFERHVNKHDLSIAHRRVEQRQRAREERESAERKELFHKMQSMSPHGRAIARAMMARNNARPSERAQESGFRVEVMSMDHSNRMESRDPQGRRRRD